jgi:uncharacterized protein DUF6152
MKKNTQLRIVLAVLALLTVGPALLSAHHGWTGYDEKAPLTLIGTVKVSGYENPHAYVDLETSDKVWHVVLAPPSRMENRGLAKDAIKAGTQVTVMGYPHKTEKTELRAERITIGGKTTELR